MALSLHRIGTGAGGLMRESLVALLVTAGLVGTYYHFKKMGMSLVPQPAAAINQPNNESKGTKNDKTNVNKHPKPRTHHGKSARGSSEADETESLPTLYSSAEEFSAGPKQPVRKREGSAKNKFLLGGVPVKAWIDSRRHALSSSRDIPTEDGMRVFLQCIELKKKGPEYLKEKDCESLLADRKAGNGVGWQ